MDTPRRALHVTRNRKSPLISGPYYAVLECERCGLTYVSPRPTPEALDRYYADEDRDGWTVRHDEISAAAKRQKKGQLAARALAPILGARGQGRALDIGCGAGNILNVLKDAGWDTAGVEPHTALAAIAVQRHRLIAEVPPRADLRSLEKATPRSFAVESVRRTATRMGRLGRTERHQAPGTAGDPRGS